MIPTADELTAESIEADIEAERILEAAQEMAEGMVEKGEMTLEEARDWLANF